MAVRLSSFDVSFTPDEDKSDWTPVRAVTDAFVDGCKAFLEKFRGEMDEYADARPDLVLFSLDLGFLPRWVRWVPFVGSKLDITVAEVDSFVDGLIEKARK